MIKLEKKARKLYNLIMKKVMKKTLAAVLAVIFLNCFLYSCGKTESGNAEKDGSEKINTVVLVSFAGGGKFSDDMKAVTEKVFTGGENSLDSYVSFISMGKTSVKTQIVAEVTVDNGADYYSPAYELRGGAYEKVNENGYDNRRFSFKNEPDPNGTKSSIDAFFRTENLVAEVNEKLKGQLSGEIKTDGDNDGNADCLTLVLCLDAAPEKESVLWAKKSRFLSGETDGLSSAYVVDEKYSEKTIKEQKIGDKSIIDYIFLPYPLLEKDGKALSSAACHEFMHVLGAADLYSYEDERRELVGELDIMAVDRSEAAPVLPLSYTLYKIGFLSEGENIAPVLSGGKYTLFSTESGKGKIKAYKLVLPGYETKRESFYIEYREKIGYGAELSNGFDGGAFIIYRVNEDNGYILPNGTYGEEYLGNAYGKDEVYVFRFMKRGFISDYTENEKVSLGGISYAAISDLPGYSSFGLGKGAADYVRYSDGDNAGVEISFVSRNEDGSATFEIHFDQSEEVAAEVDYQGIFREKSGIFAEFTSPFVKGNVYVLETDKRLSSHSAEDIVNGKFGKPTITPLAFMRAKISGEKRFVYVVYEENGNYVEKAHVIKPSEGEAEKLFVKIGVISLGSAVVLIGGIFLAAALISKKKAKNSKNIK